MKQYELLKRFSDNNGLEFNEFKSKKLQIFSEYLIEQNKEFNLTTIENPEEIEIKHFLDSFTGAPVIQKLSDVSRETSENESGITDKKDAAGIGKEKTTTESRMCVSRETYNDIAAEENRGTCSTRSNNTTIKSIIDIGTGAGFPGIPLKIILPWLDVTLLDSLNKRVNFLNKTIEKLEITGIKAIAGRAEELAKAGEPMRESFDFCTSRAVAAMPVLLEYCLPFVKVGGYCILYKSGDYKREMEESRKALEVLGGKVESVEELTLMNSDIKRAIIVIKKEMTAQIKYPRRPGKPSKSPIK